MKADVDKDTQPERRERELKEWRKMGGITTTTKKWDKSLRKSANMG